MGNRFPIIRPYVTLKNVRTLPHKTRQNQFWLKSQFEKNKEIGEWGRNFMTNMLANKLEGVPKKPATQTNESSTKFEFKIFRYYSSLQ